MKILSFAPLRNSDGLRDAAEFQNEASRFSRHMQETYAAQSQVVLFDNRGELHDRREVVIPHLLTSKPLDVLAFFCHGWPDGIQAGFSSAHARLLAREVATVSSSKLTVMLYCCSTGADKRADTDELLDPGPGGDNGFADRLRDELFAAGVTATVYAHSTKGHTSANPRVRIFTPGAQKGGNWIVAPGSKHWSKWRAALQFVEKRGGKNFVNEENTFRFDFPFMSTEQIQTKLEAT